MKKIEEIIKKSINNESKFENIIQVVNSATKKQHEIIVDMLNTLDFYQVDEDTVISAVLYVVYYKDEIDYDNIQNNYGETVESILKNLKVVSMQTRRSGEEEIENVRNMLLVMAKDLRVLIILLSYILYHTEHAKEIDTNYGEVFLHSVHDIYAPLSSRLGLNHIKSRLEAACFKALHPDEFDRLSKEDVLNKEIRQEQVEKAIKKIKSAMAEIGLQCEVMGRQKQLASVYNKMINKNLSLKQLYDLMAVRVIVNTDEECYVALGKINSEFTILPNRFKDYIASPKPNGYQSIHTCILSENNRPIEVQIRTKKMHEFAEYGVAAHWIYKSNRKAVSFDSKINWLKQIIEESESLSSKEFVENVKMDMFADEIYAQTPNGKVIKFPMGANCLDFAYAIHSEIGNKCVGAKINGKMVSISTELNNGDQCEILVSKTAKGPSRDWLKIVKTREAKNKINAYFKKELVQENIKKGKSILLLAIKERGKQPHDYLDNENFGGVLARCSLENADEMYAAIGHGSVSAEQILNKMDNLNPVKRQSTVIVENAKSSPILVNRQDAMLTRFAKCCTPIPGDEIVGFVSRGRGVTVHRVDCVNVKDLDPNRLIDVAWGGNTDNNSFIVKIKAFFTSSNNALNTIITLMEEQKIKIVSIESNLLAGDKMVVCFGILVNSNNQLSTIMTKMQNISTLDKVVRAN